MIDKILEIALEILFFLPQEEKRKTNERAGR